MPELSAVELCFLQSVWDTVKQGFDRRFIVPCTAFLKGDENVTIMACEMPATIEGRRKLAIWLRQQVQKTDAGMLCMASEAWSRKITPVELNIAKLGGTIMSGAMARGAKECVVLDSYLAREREGSWLASAPILRLADKRPLPLPKELPTPHYQADDPAVIFSRKNLMGDQ